MYGAWGLRLTLIRSPFLPCHFGIKCLCVSKVFTPDIIGGPTIALIPSSENAFASASGNQYNPHVEHDGSDYLVVWEDYRNGSYPDLYGAKVSNTGNVVNEYAINTSPLAQEMLSLSSGLNNQMLIVYSGWTDSINGSPADAMRIRGVFYPFVGIHENQSGKDYIPLNLRVLPNPFTWKTKINFSVSPDMLNNECKVQIFDVTGRLVKKFGYRPLEFSNEVFWDGTDNNGINLPAGTYFCRLILGSDVICKKIVFIK